MTIGSTGGTFCTQCGTSMSSGAATCTACGFAMYAGRNNCWNCGTHTAAGQAVCTSCGAAVVGGNVAKGSKSKIAAGLLAIFLGGFGIHKFYLGYTTPAVIMLVAGVIGFCGSFLLLPLLLLIATSIVGFIEGIIYLTKSDAEFEQIYVQGTRDWF
jgi:TM2 domain-containing membrane protein YozV